jgi:hypothetical protein
MRSGKEREGKGKAHLVAERRRRRGSTKREAAVAESSPRGKAAPEGGEVNRNLLGLGKLKEIEEEGTGRRRSASQPI